VPKVLFARQFGSLIAQRRKLARISQKELAARLIKEDGLPITPQYLNDIEHDRRNPPSGDLLDQLARQLAVPTDVLHFAAGTLPTDIRDANPDESAIVEAMTALRVALKEKRRSG
jgi:transcriptional regulator with XRE-family HTH domain